MVNFSADLFRPELLAVHCGPLFVGHAQVNEGGAVLIRSIIRGSLADLEGVQFSSLDALKNAILAACAPQKNQPGEEAAGANQLSLF